MLDKTINNLKIGIIGLGYVGLPLARLFATKFQTIGFDMNPARCQEIMAGYDSTLEVPGNLLKEVISSGKLICTTCVETIKDCNFYVVAVPTPIDDNKAPDLNFLIKASETVGSVLSKGDIVVFESTVYPGVTEDICGKTIERISGLKLNEDFYLGYSPERINPGDRVHTLENTIKITSGSTQHTADVVDAVYGTVLKNGTYRVSSIKVAEAAKAIENSQRDLNIAFVNELSKIFSRLGIDTHEVLDAAATKWNFIKMNPGLVGGHCISVDPYYLAQCAILNGYNPEVILSGRRTNDSMSGFVADQTIKLMLKKNIQILEAEIIIMGFSFKENCPDIRNTRVWDLYKALSEYNLKRVVIYDRWVDPELVYKEYGIKVVNTLPQEKFDAAVVAVAHKELRNNEIDFESILKPTHVIYDVKGILPREIIDGRL